MTKFRPIKYVLVLLSLMLVAAPSAMAQDRFTIATGGTGGVYYPYGGSLASVLSDSVPDSQWTAEETSASVDNMYLIETGDADLAFVLSDTAYDAHAGNAPFDNEVDAVSLVTLYNNYTHIVVDADAGINSVEDLAGKTVSIGSPGSGTEVIAVRILEAAGIDVDNDLTKEQLGAGESVGAMKDGLIDAFFWSGGLPTASVLDLVATPNLNIAFLSSDAYLDQLAETYGPFYSIANIPAGTYGEAQEDIPVIVVPNVLVAHADMDDEMAYNIVKAMFDNKPTLEAAQPTAVDLTLETAQCSQALPYHPGALRYFEEQGIAPETCDVGDEASPEASPAS